jgi:hypothetical protein
VRYATSSHFAVCFPRYCVACRRAGGKEASAVAKAGDADAAEALVGSLANRGCLTELAPLLREHDVRLLPVHALESEGVNEIPAALAELLSEWLDLPSPAAQWPRLRQVKAV